MNNIQPSPITVGSRGSSCESIPRVSPLPDTPAFEDSQKSSNAQHDEFCDMNIDILAVMLRQERDYTPATFSRHQSSLTDAPAPKAVLPVMYPEWRSKICDWSYRVVDHFRYDREIVGVAMNLFDRYSTLLKASEEANRNLGSNDAAHKMSFDGVNHRKDHAINTSPRSVTSCYSENSYASLTSEEEEESKRYQLGAMTALFLSIKLHAESSCDEDPYAHEDYSRGHRRRKRRLKLLSFVELSRGQFHPADISEMERVMLSALKWKVNPPTPTSFVGYLLKLLPTTDIVQQDLVLHVLHELSRYLTELSVCLTDVSTLYRPSWVAYAAILISIDTIRTDALPLEHRAAFFEAAARLSSQAVSGQVLSPDCKAIHYLMGRIRTSFLPEMLLDASSSPPAADGTQVSGEAARQGHPIAIARDAGLLNLNVLRAISNDVDVMTFTPSPSDEEDYQSASAKSTSSSKDSVHRRGQSANSVMDQVNAWESAHHPTAWSQ